MDAGAQLRSSLTEALLPWGISCDDEQLNALTHHYLCMIQTNRTLNLTRITDPQDAAVRHYADSLSLLLFERRERPTIRSVLDIGTGAGFPSLPLAILRPEWTVTAIDGTRKKVEFLEAVAAELRIDNLHPVWAHSDHWDSADRFDMVTCRALGPLGECLMRAAERVAPGGWIVAYKSAELSAEEERDAHETERTLNLHRVEPIRYRLNSGVDPLHRQLIIERPCG